MNIIRHKGVSRVKWRPMTDELLYFSFVSAGTCTHGCCTSAGNSWASLPTAILGHSVINYKHDPLSPTCDIVANN